MQICPNCFAQENDNARFCGLCGKPLVGIDTDENPLIGRRIDDKYVITELIARGGMGEVYLGEHASLGQKVAVKILNKRYKGDATVVMRFFNEAKSYCRVSHPNAVKLHDFGQLDDGTLYMIMEFVPGETLTAHLARKGPLGTRRTTQLGLMLADVLLAAHSQGVIHRDLKPDNIMLQEVSKGRYQLKVLDFGIAKVFDEASGSQLTETGMVFGTPEFMSPEQAQGFDVDHRTDIYAFGMLLYYMITANLPFHGGAKLSILNRQVHEAPKRPSELAPALDIDARIEAVIMKCLEKKRQDRYLDFEAVLADLERVAAGAPPLLGKTPRAARHDEVTVSGAQVSYASTPALDVVVKRGPSTEHTVRRDPLQAMFDAAASKPQPSVTVVRDADPKASERDAETRVAHQTEPPSHDATRRVGAEFDNESPALLEPTRRAVPHDAPPTPDTGPNIQHSAPRVLGTLGFGESQPMILGAEHLREDTGPSLVDSQPLEQLSPLDRSGSGPYFVDPEPIVIADAGSPGAPIDEDVPTGEQAVVEDDGFSFGGGDDGFVMSIGDIDDASLPSGGHRPQDRRSSAPLIGIFLVIAAAGAALWWFVLRDAGGESESTEPEAALVDETGANPDEADVVEPDIAEPEVDQAAPIPAGTRVDTRIRALAVSTALTDIAERRLRDAEFDAARKALEKIDERPTELRSEQRQRLDALSSELETGEALYKAAKKSAKRLRCDEVLESADGLEAIAKAAAVELRQEAEKCKSKLSKPPSRIE